MPLICYDLRFPVWARSRKTDENPWEYDLLIYVANWPKPRIHAWDALLRARSIENQSYCVGVNRIGTDENGMEYSEAVLKVEVDGSIKVYNDFVDKPVMEIKLKELFPLNIDSVSMGWGQNDETAKLSVSYRFTRFEIS